MLHQLFSSCGEWGLVALELQWWPHCGGLPCGRAGTPGHSQTPEVAARGLNRRRSQTLEPRLNSCGARAQLLRDMWNISSLTRDQIHVPCIARQIFNHWATREVPAGFFLSFWYQLRCHLLSESSPGHFFFNCKPSHIVSSC